MKMSKVYYSREMSREFYDFLKDEIKENFKGSKEIAVKIHFGEPGNQYAFKPEDVKVFIDILKELKIKFFMYDSSTSYNSPRGSPKTHEEVAIEKGWSELGPISTDDSEFIKVKGRHFDYEVCKPLVDADGVLVITHFKGHMCSGFGGSIKNLGMGALTKKSKSDIHDGAKPVFDGDCIQCKACERSCPVHGIKVDDYPEFNACIGCSICQTVCPESSIKPKVDYFDTLLAEGANAAFKNFKKAYFINVAKNITKRCDCASDPEGIIAADVGYFASEDPVAIDMACYDKTVEEEGKDVFKERNKKSGTEQVYAAEKFKMGSVRYDLQEIGDS